MKKTVIRRFQCRECPCRKVHDDLKPGIIAGKVFHYGDWYCTGGKKPRRFRPSDPKVYPPAWCPRKKDPVECRIYAYKDSKTWLLHHWLQADGTPDIPCGYEFALRAEGCVDFSAAAFQRETAGRCPSDVLGIPVCDGEVVEIDDGLRPCFFHITKEGVCHLPFFNGASARENQYQAEDG